MTQEHRNHLMSVFGLSAGAAAAYKASGVYGQLNEIERKLGLVTKAAAFEAHKRRAGLKSITEINEERLTRQKAEQERDRISGQAKAHTEAQSKGVYHKLMGRPFLPPEQSANASESLLSG